MTHIYDMDGSKGGGLVAQVKNGQKSDGSGWLHGGEGGIHRNWMSRAIISIVSGSAISVPDIIFVLFLAFQVRCVCLGFRAEY